MAPIVHDYTADTAPGGPLDLRQAREADTGGVGNALANLGNSVTQTGQAIQQHEAQAEVSDVQAKISQANADFTVGLDQTFQNADPDDKTVADQFMQSFDDKMGEIGDNLSTPEAQAAFQKANSQMRGHFQVAAYKNQAALSGQNAVDNLNTSLDNNSAALIQDPSSFDHVRQLQEDSIQAQVDAGLLPQNKADELQAAGETQLAKSTLQGWINIGAPEKALADLKAGKWDDYLNGDETFQMTKMAETGINAKAIESKRAQSVNDDALAQKNEATANTWLSQIQNNQLSTKTILADPDMPEASKEHFLKLVNDRQSGQFDRNDAVYAHTLQSIVLPDGAPGKISDPAVIYAKIGHGLDPDGATKLAGMIQKTPDGKANQQMYTNMIGAARNVLVKAGGIPDPEGQKQFGSYLADTTKAWQAGLAAGKTPRNMTDPKSPDYIGDYRPYIRTNDQKLQSMSQMMNPPPQNVVPRQPGETPAQYRARTGK